MKKKKEHVASRLKRGEYSILKKKKNYLVTNNHGGNLNESRIFPYRFRDKY